MNPMAKKALLLVLTLVCLRVDMVAQPVASGERSAQQGVVLSYFHDVLDRGRIELLENLFHPDCAVHRPEGDFTGIDGLRGIVERRKTTYSKFATEVHDIFESGDRVVVRLTHTATGSGVFRSRIGIHDVKGKSVFWQAIVIFRMKNGKIAEECVSRDELGILLSAGALKAI